MTQSEQEYGPVGSRVIFENEEVRVWEIVLEAGETLPFHHHTLPYLVVTIEGTQVRVEEHDGQIYEPNEEPGTVTFRQAGQIHALHNISNQRFANRLIELKQQARE